MKHDNLKEIFWANNNAIKRKTKKSGELEAQKEQLLFVQKNIACLSEEDLNDTFGSFAGFVKRWIKAELITNKFGKHLYVKLGE